LKHVQILDWQEFLFIKVVLVQEQLLRVVGMVNYNLRKHIANLAILELDISFVLNENAQVGPID
jgi:hypothetical protein